MKKALLYCWLFFCTATSFAQQRPHYTQYILNNYILNPALSGIENYTDVKMSVRDQWAGLDGAPKTTYVSIHGPIGKKDYKTSATSFQVPGENPRGTSYWENYTASAPHHGVGMTMIHDQTGNFNRFTANVSYAYHLGLSATTNIAAGFSGGISRIGRNLAKTDFGNGNPYDPALGNGTDFRKLWPDLNAGIWLYGSDFFAGFALQQIIPVRLSFSNDPALGTGKLVPHIFTTTGYRFLLNEEVNVIPSVMVKYVSGTPTTPQVDANIKAQYLDLFWAGASYRFKEGYAAMAGLNVGNTFTLGYAYDFTVTRLNTASRGTHELLIGFLIGNRYSDSCPRNIW